MVLKLQWIGENVAAPLFRRVGTALSGYLLGIGFTTGEISILLEAAVILGAVLFDLSASRTDKLKTIARERYIATEITKGLNDG